MSAALRAPALLLPVLVAVLDPAPAHASPAPRQIAPVQFRCETGAVWMEDCNECRCQSGNHVVCAHLACLRDGGRDAAEAAGEPNTVCYQGACAAGCDTRVDDGGCHICDCDPGGGDARKS
ncbi:uncharacterized protein LOC119100627 [Pollicipes pollicipes]|uniref:uncharacterized protein LOC119100627 n=1 Tax=Pollicipes pollicipes TaxID=41117 RepID=UPI00188576AA|nr:uncharacterized protein LOC119100627 [Pollicipes pollicipes]